MSQKSAELINPITRGPRMFAGGFDPNDFLKVIDEAKTWADRVKLVSAYADERVQPGEEALAVSRNLSAGEYFISAGLYYHYAQLSYSEDPESKAALKVKSQEAYKKGMGLVWPPLRRLDIPHEDYTMAAYLRLPEIGAASYPMVFLLPGVDSVKEEYFAFSEVFLKRGIATLAFEGPGQGETRAFRAMWNYESARTISRY